MVPTLDGIAKSIDDFGYCITADGKSVSARIWAMPADSGKAAFKIFYMENRILKGGRVYVKIEGNVPASCAESYMEGILKKRIVRGVKPFAYEVAEVSE